MIETHPQQFCRSIHPARRIVLTRINEKGWRFQRAAGVRMVQTVQAARGADCWSDTYNVDCKSRLLNGTSKFDFKSIFWDISCMDGESEAVQEESYVVQEESAFAPKSPFEPPSETDIYCYGSGDEMMDEERKAKEAAETKAIMKAFAEANNIDPSYDYKSATKESVRVIREIAAKYGRGVKA